MVNHFEFDPEISNKKTMFINMLEYCSKKNLNPFDYLPLTIIINFTECNENLKNFEVLFDNIKDYLADKVEPRLNNSNVDKSLNNDLLYSSLFKIESNIDYLKMKIQILIMITLI